MSSDLWSYANTNTTHRAAYTSSDTTTFWTTLASSIDTTYSTADYETHNSTFAATYTTAYDATKQSTIHATDRSAGWDTDDATYLTTK